MLPHQLTNFEIQKYYQNKSKSHGVYSKNNLPKIKDEAYVINLNFKFKSIGTHLITLSVNGNNIIYFDSSGVGYIPKEIKTFIGNKRIITNIYRIQAFDLIMCGCFCIGFIDFMLKDNSLLEYANLFSPHKNIFNN